jgi:polar amino acid transport system ATP-binding protein
MLPSTAWTKRLVCRVVRLARSFFAQEEAEKMRIPMSAGGTAWRGFFPTGGELTSGRPDWKEGLYLAASWAGTPARAQWRDPARRQPVAGHPGFRATVLAYIDALEALGHTLMRGCALGLGLPEQWFEEHGTRDPLLLLRFFNYPARPVPPDVPASWGVGEHTDYGLLTMLWQDDVGGLQVRTDDGWVDAPPIPAPSSATSATCSTA